MLLTAVSSSAPERNDPVCKEPVEPDAFVGPFEGAGVDGRLEEDAPAASAGVDAAGVAGDSALGFEGVADKADSPVAAALAGAGAACAEESAPVSYTHLTLPTNREV